VSAGKRAKIWKRTWVGGSIAAGLALILWIASVLDSGVPVLAIAAVVLAVCLVEVHRMGTLAGRRLGWVLAPVGALVVLLAAAALDELEGAVEMPSVETWTRAWTAEALVHAALAIPVLHGLLRSQSTTVRVAAVALAALAITLGFEWSMQLEFVALVLFLFLLIRERGAELMAVTLLGALLVVSLPGLAIAWRAFDHVGLVALLVIAKIGDTAGYYVGSAIGKHRPFTNVSPNKSLEGCAGSLGAAVLCGAACVPLGWLPAEPWGLWGGAAAGAVVNVTAQTSDLLESWVKRRAGVKDAGTWFGPSGGMLDLVDSFFLAVPAALLVWPLVLRFPPLAHAP
jgi:phosphatidate cytidylyltransferase